MPLPPLPTVYHPLLVHFTIGLVPAAAAFATLAAWRRREWAARASLWTLGGVAILTAVTVLLGFVDYFAVAPELEGTPARDTLEWHERLGVVTGATIVGTAIVALWRRQRVLTQQNWRWALAVALWVATGLVLVTGWFGGSLVYDLGVNTPP